MQTLAPHVKARGAVQNTGSSACSTDPLPVFRAPDMLLVSSACNCLTPIPSPVLCPLSCDWDDCQCGDCEVCGGPLPTEFSSEERQARAVAAVAQAAALVAADRAAEDAAAAAAAAARETTLAAQLAAVVAIKTPVTLPVTGGNDDTDSLNERARQVFASIAQMKVDNAALDQRINATKALADGARAGIRQFEDLVKTREATMDALNQTVLRSLTAQDDPPPELSESEQRAVLDGAPSLAAIVDRWKCGAYRNVVVIMGAGVSTAAGIVDFRTPGTGCA